MKEIAYIIRSVYNEYKSNGITDVELCSWIRDRLCECMSGHPTNTLNRSVRYQEAYIDFIDVKKMFCIYKNSADGECVDVCMPLATYVMEEFGVPITDDLLMSIDISYVDVMQMAERITDDICIWVTRLEGFGAEI
jgi:hypothetical protein